MIKSNFLGITSRFLDAGLTAVARGTVLLLVFGTITNVTVSVALGQPPPEPREADVTFNFLNLEPPDAQPGIIAGDNVEYLGEWRVTNNEPANFVESTTFVRLERFSVVHQDWFTVIDTQEEESRILAPAQTEDIEASGAKVLSVAGSYRVLTVNRANIILAGGGPPAMAAPATSNVIKHFFTVNPDD